MVIKKSKGITRTEKLLATLCDQTFLKLWSYANPCKEGGKELCDVLAIFDDNIFIFFDRESLILKASDKNLKFTWQRWKKKVIESQIKTASGAEKYIRSGKPIYLDARGETSLPLSVPSDRAKIHKIIVAHGASEACKNASEDNINGSLCISYGTQEPDSSHDFPIDLSHPFTIDLDNDDPVHIFDSYNLEIVLRELDTFYDFVSYVEAKEEAIRKLLGLMYTGEEELLAYYFRNFDEEENLHFIKDKNAPYGFLGIDQGVWHEFIQSDSYKRKKDEDEVSYLWDGLIQRTCQHALDGTLITEHDFFKDQNAVHEMAKEPRFIRRALSRHMLRAFHKFPDVEASSQKKGMWTFTSYMPSFYKNKGYVFLQFYKPEIKNYEEYRQVRKEMLHIACGVTKNKNPQVEKVIGIATEPPKLSEQGSEDLILLDCREWSAEDRKYYEDANKVLGFLEQPSLQITKMKENEFPE
ncbi:MAG: hypothetical protein ABIH69_05875 [bacterium]